MSFFSDISEKFKEKKYDKNKSNFNEDIWKDLNIDQKKQCINSFEEEVAFKKGRPPVDIIYEDMENEKCGSYNGNTIKINSKLLDVKQPYELIYAICHEQQHAFQNYSICNNKVETSEQYMWKLNLMLNSKSERINYYEPGKTDSEFKMYYLQPVEYNSNAIALESCKIIFNKYESKEFDKWSSLKENVLENRVKDVYFENDNFQNDMLNRFENHAKNIGYNIENFKENIVDLKNIEWITKLKDPQLIKKFEDMKKISFEDTEPLDISEVRAKLNESKKQLEDVLTDDEKLYETTEVNKIDNTKGIVHIYQLNNKPEKCFLGKKEANKIKKLSEVKTISLVKKEFKELNKYMVENSKTIDKKKIKTENLSL